MTEVWGEAQVPVVRCHWCQKPWVLRLADNPAEGWDYAPDCHHLGLKGGSQPIYDGEAARALTLPAVPGRPPEGPLPPNVTRFPERN